MAQQIAVQSSILENRWFALLFGMALLLLPDENVPSCLHPFGSCTTFDMGKGKLTFDGLSSDTPFSFVSYSLIS